ncbi:phosphate/phosphite/phosphonate ABC transporter substrate-binding protein [Allonocardiopsis opalescens]|uniref:ABC-type phosphate/phosphonate transport system substrate-binding protein n=1 Tax=Allonocardiopsis opalescens TaxID=1144618 RepID=A0A2T0PS62_9ACTN|nr:PhnD/SsuA/transferrin family substrate-binding protein [Allonocardiopsis opalescens]PRX91725.1 ABC-type phosphate/phosphonate transport system substrate-binding protein [Allonocardiopsis opalescens]
MSVPDALLMGAVAYDPKVVTIWEGFRRRLNATGVPFDYLLYSTYERQVEDLVAERIHAAWNSPLAWIRAERLAAAAGRTVTAELMRDTDRDLTSVVLVRADSPARTPADLAGATVAVGAVDSPQATLIPLAHLAEAGVEVKVRRFDVGVGLHGDHIGGERDAARALAAGEADAACVIDANQLLFTREGTLPPGSVRVLAQTERYDHCNMTVVDTAPRSLVDPFIAALRAMSYADAAVRPLLDLEGLTSWEPGRTDRYAALARAVDRFGFYGADGTVTAAEYRP